VDLAPVRLLAVSAPILACACASSSSEGWETERPFIKLSNRDIALFVFWRGTPEPGYHQAFERELVKRLTNAYHTEPVTRRIEGSLAEPPPDVILELVERGIDDVVLVETRMGAERRVEGRIQIRALATNEIVEKLEIPGIVGKRGEPPTPERVADFVTVKITHHWTDPAKAPELDPILVANRLADQGACKQAVDIFRKGYSGLEGSAHLTELSRNTAAKERFERCEHKLEAARLVEADRRATFTVEIEAKGMADAYAGAVARAVAGVRLAEKMSPHTDKPVIVRVTPVALTLDVRYDAERYRRATVARPKYISEQPVVYLEPFLPMLEALIGLQGAIREALPPFDRKAFDEIPTVLRLRKLADHVEIDCARRGSEILVGDKVVVKAGAQNRVEVASTRPWVSRTLELVLGPPRSSDGSPTTYGLVFDFFELAP
jgi:hypothetical protein